MQTFWQANASKCNICCTWDLVITQFNLNGNRVYSQQQILYIRWLRASGVVLAGEKVQRQLSKELLGTDLVEEPAPMSFSLLSGGEELRVAPLVYVPDLEEKVIQLLEQNADRYI